MSAKNVGLGLLQLGASLGSYCPCLSIFATGFPGSKCLTLFCQPVRPVCCRLLPCPKTLETTFKAVNLLCADQYGSE